MFFKMKKVAVLAAIVLGGIGAQAQAADVTVTFSERLQGLSDRINHIEQKREEAFRKYRDDRMAFRTSGSRRMARAIWDNVGWAGERLIDDVDQYTMTNLITSMVNYSLDKANMGDKVGRVDVYLDKLRVEDHSLGLLRGNSNYASGRMVAWDMNGNKIGEKDFSSTFTPLVTASRHYDGPDMAFADLHENTRIGPTLGYFIYKGLDKVLGDADFPRPITVLYND